VSSLVSNCPAKRLPLEKWPLIKSKANLQCVRERERERREGAEGAEEQLSMKKRRKNRGRPSGSSGVESSSWYIDDDDRGNGIKLSESRMADES
jgi:hypothetical protein